MKATALTSLGDRSAKQGGLTIVELVVTIVILAIALAGIALMVRQGLSESADVMLESRAVALGQAYLDEIMARRYDERSSPSGRNPCFGLAGGRRCSLEAEFGPDGSEAGNRQRFDDVDDYHGLAEGAGEATDLRDAEGNTRPGYDNFRVEVNVRYAGDDPVPGLSKSHAKLVTVEVSFGGQAEGWNFSAYKANY